MKEQTAKKVKPDIRAITRLVPPEGNLVQGQSELSIDPQLAREAFEIIAASKNHYGGSEGDANLRRAVADKIKRYNGIEVDLDRKPLELMITNGGTGALIGIAQSYLRDKSALVFEPYYPYHRRILEEFGAKTETFELDEKLTFEKDALLKKCKELKDRREFPLKAITHEERWFIMQVSAMHGKDGGAVVSHTNITDRKKAEIKLKNSEEFNRSIFENSPDCINVLELDGTFHSMNTNGLSLMEIEDSTSFDTKLWIDYWEGDENELAYQAVQAALNRETAHFEGFCKTSKGNLKWWDVSVAPVFDTKGKPRRLISTARDITARRQAEREREELFKREQAARKEAEIANRMRDEFLATVSHELRAPLNSILGWARLLEKGKLDETTSKKAINTIVRNSEAQNRLIEDLLDVSRIIWIFI